MIPTLETFNGLPRCSACAIGAIDDTAGAEMTFLRVREKLVQKGLRCDIPVKVLIRNRDVLLRRSIFPVDGCAGVTLWQSSNDGRVQISVALTIGYPLAHFEWIAAHEWGHVFLIARGSRLTSGLLVEGFCEYVAYTHLLDTDYADRDTAIRDLTQGDDDYSRGLRMIRSAVKGHGSKAVTRALVAGHPEIVGL
jgi:hypothetical protein